MKENNTNNSNIGNSQKADDKTKDQNFMENIGKVFRGD